MGSSAACPVSVAQRSGTIVAAVGALSGAGIGVDDLTLRQPTLDDVFLTLTGHAAEDDPSASSDEGDH